LEYHCRYKPGILGWGWLGQGFCRIEEK